MSSATGISLKFSYVDNAVHQHEAHNYQQVCYISAGDDTVRYQQYIANSLSLIATSATQCDKILNDIKKFEESDRYLMVINGTDVELIVDRTNVVQVIKLNKSTWVNQADGRFYLNTIKKAFQGWRDFLKMPKAIDTVYEVELSEINLFTEYC
ncbi:MAG: hypothetical protein ACC657_17770 [Thiohalomonadales bacterium]